MKYDELGVLKVWLTTKNGKDAQYGRDRLGSQTVPIQFGQDGFMMFGFIGRERTLVNEELTSLGVVQYNYQCVQLEREKMNDRFTWGFDATIFTAASFRDREAERIVAAAGDPEMPNWMKILFLVSFSLNFIGILVISLCCFCRKKKLT